MGLWFLPLLFIADLIVKCILKVKKQYQVLIVILIAALGIAYAKFVGVPLPWGIDAAMIAQLFIYFGFCLKQNFTMDNEQLILQSYDSGNNADPDNRINIYRLLLCVCLCINIILNLINTCNYNFECVDMYYLRYGNPFLYFISSFMGIFFICGICKYLLARRNFKILKFISANTLHIYCLHGLVLAVLWKVSEGLNIQSQIGDIFAGILFTAITLTSCCIIIFFTRYALSIGIIQKK